MTDWVLIKRIVIKTFKSEVERPPVNKGSIWETRERTQNLE